MIALASDHGGFLLKEAVKRHLEQQKIPFKDYGTDSEASCDYPLAVVEAVGDIRRGTIDKGLFFCGTGIGISIAANKHVGIRAACCSEAFSARLSREHNDANVLCLGGRVVAPAYACSIVDAFLETRFHGGERHCRRIQQIAAFDGDKASPDCPLPLETLD